MTLWAVRCRYIIRCRFLTYDPDKYHLYQSESKLNLSYLKRNFVAVIADVKENPIVLMAEPNNAALLMEIESALGIDSYEICVGLPNQVLQYLGEGAGGGGAPGEMDEILDEIGTSAEELDETAEEMSDDAPAVVRFSLAASCMTPNALMLLIFTLIPKKMAQPE